ncbi:hypothetical protein B0T13DRAFT_444480 [Neurospora crassa]|nr:hypothetical protein B0T13DRAFT_444480 [Neurospora crassa]
MSKDGQVEEICRDQADLFKPQFSHLPLEKAFDPEHFSLKRNDDIVWIYEPSCQCNPSYAIIEAMPTNSEEREVEVGGSRSLGATHSSFVFIVRVPFHSLSLKSMALESQRRTRELLACPDSAVMNRYSQRRNGNGIGSAIFMDSRRRSTSQGDVESGHETHRRDREFRKIDAIACETRIQVSSWRRYIKSERARGNFGDNM